MDQRETKTNKKVVCKYCSFENWDDYMNCYNCLSKLSEVRSNITMLYKYGKVSYTKSEETAKNDYVRKHAADLLQPSYYDKVTKKIEPNPDFYKVWGNPYKKATVGGEVEKAIQSEQIILENK